MTIGTIDESQRRAAKVVGVMYLLTMAIAVFSYYVRGQFVILSNVAETARNIAANEMLFRLSLASDLITVLGVAALIAALYVVLKSVNPNLALFAALVRALEISIGIMALLNYFDVLRALSGSNYLQVFSVDQLQALARFSIGAHSAGVNLGFIFLGMGSTVFCYLWFKSNYIPKALSILGIFGSLLLAAGSFAIVIFPNLASLLSLKYMMPLGLFEVTVGFWLLIKGLRPAAT